MNSPRAIVMLTFVVAAGVLLYLLAPILTPFFTAALLAYIANPIVRRLTAWRIPRAVAVTLVFVALLALAVGLLIFLVPLVQRQVVAFAQKLPFYLDWVQTTLVPRIEQLIGERLPVNFSDARGIVMGHWQEIGNFLSGTLAGITSSGMRVVLWLVNLVLIPIVMLYLMLDWDKLLANALALFPPSMRATIARLSRETDDVLGSFLRGQLLVMFALATIYSIGLLIVGLDLALPIGIMAGFLCFVPYLGFVVGVVSAGVAAYLQFQDPTVLAWVFLVFFVAQLLEGYVLTPRWVGSRIGLHPLAVIFSVLAAGQLFGFIGVLLALPTAAALKVWLHHLHQSYIVAPPKAQRARRLRTLGEVEPP